MRNTIALEHDCSRRGTWPKIRTSCHADCGIGTYFFITPEGDAVPIPRPLA